jgi:hypothetical protein
MMADEWTPAEKGFSLSEEEQNGVMIAVNTILHGSWTPAGAEKWWDRARHELGGHTPREALPYRPTEVIELALRGMMQGGS